MSDRGTPRTLRHMNGYGSHTFMWVNGGGERFWVKYHFSHDVGRSGETLPARRQRGASAPARPSSSGLT